LLQSKIRDRITQFGPVLTDGARGGGKHHPFDVSISVGTTIFRRKSAFVPIRPRVGFDFNPDLRDQQRISACMHGMT
jgi:hypothetical protein